jgi:hypothetical protein
MDRKLWGKVREGDFLIYASPYDGVFKVLVKDVDIRFYDPDEKGKWTYPYGLTKDTGTVQVQRDGALEILNLGDLMKWKDDVWSQLSTLWQEYLKRNAELTEALDKFNALYLTEKEK